MANDAYIGSLVRFRFNFEDSEGRTNFSYYDLPITTEGKYIYTQMNNEEIAKVRGIEFERDEGERCRNSAS